MRKIGGMLLLVLMLTGCGGTNREMDRCLALRSRLLKAQTVTFETELTADYGDKLFTFSLAVSGDSQGNVTVQVLAPESISGITGVIDRQGGRLTFDGRALQFDLMADGKITPLSAPWVLLQALRGGCLTAAGTEDGVIRMSVDDSYREDALHLDIWLDGEDLPAKGEILWGGRKILSLSIKNLVIS